MASRDFRPGESCSECGTTEGKTLGAGMCSSCYQKKRRERLKNNPVESNPDSEPDFEILPDGDFEEQFESDEIVPGFVPDPSLNQEQFSKTDEKESLGAKAKDWLLGKPKEKPLRPTFQTNETKPGEKNKKRESAADVISLGFNQIGGLISRSPRHRPSGILLQWQSDAAGEVIDEAVKDTFIDKLFLQKAVKGKGKLDQVGAILIPPMIVFAIEMNPARFEQLSPMLENSLRNALPQMAKGIKKAKKKQEAQKEAVAELFPDLEPGQDPIQILMSEMFAGWYSEAPQQEQEGE